MASPGIKLRDAGGALRTLSRIRLRDAGGTLRTITRVRMRDATNTLRIVYDSTGASTFSASPSAGLVTAQDVGTATTNTVTVTPSGGTAPYTYAWTLLESDGAVEPTATAPASATTAFVQTSMSPGNIYSSEWRCTVTDSSTPALTATCDVTARFADIS